MDESKTLYALLGGPDGLRQLVDRFYDHMAARPESVGIREMHPEDLSLSRQKLFEFLSGWSGGPPLFTQKYGYPRLRARHLPFKIGKPERDQWMMCMVLAAEDVGLKDPTKSELIEALLQVADHMRNQPQA